MTFVGALRNMNFGKMQWCGLQLNLEIVIMGKLVDQNAICPKCSHDVYGIRHCNGPCASVGFFKAVYKDHFHRVCGTCEYGWITDIEGEKK